MALLSVFDLRRFPQVVGLRNKRFADSDIPLRSHGVMVTTTDFKSGDPG